MKSINRRFGIKLALSAGLLGIIPAIAAAEYPERAITLVIPYTPGGPADVLGRYVAQQASTTFGQPIVVENKPGASLTIGTDYVSRAKPDGYTLLLGAASMLVQSPAGRTPRQNLEDFAPISVIGNFPTVLTVNPKLPVNNVKELVGYVKAHPDEVYYGSSGVGSLTHLAGALFEHMAGLKMTHVPYRGVNEAMNDVASGQIQLAFPGAPIGLPLAKTGRVRALAVTSAERTATDPTLPTVAESGLQGYAVNPWYGLLAPAGTPRPIIDRWHAEVQRILRDPEVKKHWLTLGADPTYSETPGAFAAMMREESERWADLIESANIQLK
jgi:tripartite-type tricarboxylate transporter receptor subunit TctC